MMTVIFLAIEENFRKGKEEVESQTGFGIFEQIFTLSLHNAYYAVFFGVLFSRVITSVNQANWGPFEDFKTFS